MLSNKSIWMRYLHLRCVSSSFWCDLFAGQIAVDLIMTEFSGVIGNIGQRIVDLADQQILAILQTSNGLSVSFHNLQT
jgi:hypothetical protein